jgi:hypothetical protein
MSTPDRAEYLLMVRYFWEEKGDVERYVCYTPELTRQYSPALATALQNYKDAKAVLDAVIRGECSYDV